jgi:hypothetical protein
MCWHPFQTSFFNKRVLNFLVAGSTGQHMAGRLWMGWPQRHRLAWDQGGSPIQFAREFQFAIGLGVGSLWPRVALVPPGPYIYDAIW